MVIGRPRGNNSWTSQSSGYDGPPGAQLAMPNMSTFRHGKIGKQDFFYHPRIRMLSRKNSDATLRKFGATPIYTQPKERNSTGFDPK